MRDFEQQFATAIAANPQYASDAEWRSTWRPRDAPSVVNLSGIQLGVADFTYRARAFGRTTS